MRLVSLLLSFILSTAIQAYHNDHDYGIGSNLRQLQTNMTVLPEEIRTTIREEINKSNADLLTAVREEIWAVNQMQLAAFVENYGRQVAPCSGIIPPPPCYGLNIWHWIACRVKMFGYPGLIINIFFILLYLPLMIYIFARLIRHQQHRRGVLAR